MDLKDIKPAMLAEYIGSEFEVIVDPSNAFSLRLSEVVEHNKTEHTESFSLFFRGPLNHFMPQGTYRLNHGKLGELELFIVPTGEDRDSFQYEAAFNHLF